MKKTSGYLHKRGDNFYVSWRFKGKAFLKVLRDENGNPITHEREAKKAKDELMAPFAATNQVDVLASIAGKLEGRKTEIAKWEDEKNPPLSIGRAWSEFLASPNRPDSGDSTLRQYEFQWQAFADWMKEKHADKLAFRDVTKEIAEEYASSMNHGKFSPSTYNKHLNLLTLVFRILKHKAKLANNPWEDIQRKRIGFQPGANQFNGRVQHGFLLDALRASSVRIGSSYVLLGKSDGDGCDVGVQQAGETSGSGLHKF